MGRECIFIKTKKKWTSSLTWKISIVPIYYQCILSNIFDMTEIVLHISCQEFFHALWIISVKIFFLSWITFVSSLELRYWEPNLLFVVNSPVDHLWLSHVLIWDQSFLLLSLFQNQSSWVEFFEKSQTLVISRTPRLALRKHIALPCVGHLTLIAISLVTGRWNWPLIFRISWRESITGFFNFSISCFRELEI